MLQGLHWTVHVRDRLPPDLVQLLPSLLKDLHRGTAAAQTKGADVADPDAGSGDEGDGEGAGGAGLSAVHGEAVGGGSEVGASYQLRPAMALGLGLLEEVVDRAKAILTARQSKQVGPASSVSLLICR